MARNTSNAPKEKVARAAGTPPYRPFTRFDEHGSTNTDEFRTRGMGIAAKE